MANLHSEFETFHKLVALTTGEKESLRKSRNAIRDLIRKYFRENLKVTVPKFLGQGSYAMGTIINPLDCEFDIDDGELPQPHRALPWRDFVSESVTDLNNS